LTVSRDRAHIILGISAIMFFTVHGLYIIFMKSESWGNLLWTCHLGTVLIGIGCIARIATLNAAGLLWLVLGDFMWILYLTGGGELYLTSPLTHVGGLIIGILGARILGIPRFSWIVALVLMAGVQQACRWVTTESDNINLAFKVHEGWETMFPDYTWYVLLLLGISGLTFYSFQVIFRIVLNTKSLVQD
jgi:hypothetical protein